MFKKVKKGILEQDSLKSSKLKLSIAKNDSTKNLAKQKNSNSRFHLSTNKGISINGKKFIVKSMGYQVSGFDKKSGKVITRKDVGNSLKRIMDYIKREDSQNDYDSENSLLYNFEKELTHDELKDLKSNIEELAGVHHLAISAGQDLDREENAIMVRNTMSRFKEETGKNMEYVFAFHTDKLDKDGEIKNAHAHIVMYSETNKNDIMINNEQLQMLKIIAAEETLKILDDRGDHDKFLEREIQHSKELHEKIQISNDLMNQFKESKSDLAVEEQFNLKIEFAKQENPFSKEDLEIFSQLQKAKGYETHLERTNGDEKKLEFIKEKIGALENSLEDKNIEEKLKAMIEDFKSSDAAKSIHSNATDERLIEASKTGREIEKQTGFKDKEEQLIDRELTSNRDIKFSTDSAVESLLKGKDQLEQEFKDMKEFGKDFVSLSNAEKIQELSKNADRSASMDSHEMKSEAEAKASTVASERNQLKEENSDSLLFKQKQQEFMNLKFVEKDGLNMNELNEWKSNVVSNNQLSETNAQQFLDNSIKHAEELVKAGIFDENYKFTDERSREILLTNADKSVEKIAEINLEDLKGNKESSLCDGIEKMTVGKETTKFEEHYSQKQ